ncbi:MAG: hypothetical protein LC793_05925 [Thermomicrobia bacterium]|nr:hypothetical protein [Thermomicrobia bacterium]
MSEQRDREAMQWVAQAMADGFSGEESFMVREDNGLHEIVIWLNDRPEGFTRLRLLLTSVSDCTPEQFRDGYLGTIDTTAQEEARSLIVAHDEDGEPIFAGER